MVRVDDIVEKLGLTVYSGHEGLVNRIAGGYVSDLLSDVMGHATEGQVWITLQTHKNIMAVASLRDLSAIILVKDLMPAEDAINQSNIEGIPILGTEKESFEIAGLLYNLLQSHEAI